MTTEQILLACHSRDVAVLWSLLEADIRAQGPRTPSKNTLHTYRTSLRHYVRYVLATETQAVHLDVERYVQWLRDQGGSPATIHLRVRIARRLIQILQEHDVPGVDIVHTRASPLPSLTPVTARQPYTDQQITELLARADLEEKLILLLSLEAGLRVGEMTRLTVPDLIYVEHAVTGQPELHCLVIEQYRNGAATSVQVTDTLRSTLNQWMDARRSARVTGDHVLTIKKTDAVKQRLQQLCARSGVVYEGKGVEGLRLTAGARIYRSTQSVAEVMTRMRVGDQRNARRFIAAAALLSPSKQV